MNAIAFLKKKFAAKTGSGDKPAVDKFGLNIGSFVSISAGVFACMDESLISNLRIDMLKVAAVSRVRLENSDLEIRRYYLDWYYTGSTGPRPGVVYLQIMGSFAESAIYSINKQVLQTHPQDEEELLSYQGRGYGLGESVYTLADQHAVPEGMPEMSAAIADGLVYQRDLDGGDYVRPLSAVEEMIFDSEGASGLKQALRFAPYCRSLPVVKDPERLTISLVTGISKNHQPSSECRVDFFAGIDVPVSKIQIIA